MIALLIVKMFFGLFKEKGLPNKIYFGAKVLTKKILSKQTEKQFIVICLLGKYDLFSLNWYF